MAISLGLAHLRAKKAYLKSYHSLVAVVQQTHLLKIRFRPNLKIWFLVWTLVLLLSTLRELKFLLYKSTSTQFWAFKARMIMRSFKIYSKATKLWWPQHFTVLTLKILQKGLLQCNRLILWIQMNRRKHNSQRPIRISVQEVQEEITNQEGTKRKKVHRLTLLTLRRLMLL